jgi:nucleoside 2-deoxyribosyltransferase
MVCHGRSFGCGDRKERSDAAMTVERDAPTVLRVYLAGPDVFLPDAEQCAERKDDLPDQPAAWADLPEWQRIALRNELHMRSADALIANLTPFRGPSADVGTAYELGFMRALGRPVFGYSTTAVPFTQRSRDFAAARGGAVAGAGGAWRDADGMLIEQFGLTDNLMLEAAIVGSGGRLIVEEIALEARWTDLSVFERCVEVAAATLGV